MRIDSAQLVNNPQLRYQLDPGEPGIATRAPASRSAQLVTAQELRNRVRLQRQAVADGRQVVFAHSKFTHGRDGAFLSVRDGLTIVASVERPTAARQVSPPQKAGSGEETSDRPSGDPAATAVPAALGPDESERLEDDREEITRELRQAEEKLAGAEGVGARSRRSPAVGKQAEGEARLRYEVQQLRRAKAQLEARELMLQLARLQDPVDEAAAQSREQVLGLLHAGAGPAAVSGLSQGNPSGAPRSHGFLKAHAAGGLFNAVI